jgi:hypothetical protein
MLTVGLMKTTDLFLNFSLHNIFEFVEQVKLGLHRSPEQVIRIVLEAQFLLCFGQEVSLHRGPLPQSTHLAYFSDKTKKYRNERIWNSSAGRAT